MTEYTSLQQADLSEAQEIRTHYDNVNDGIHATGGSIDWPRPYPLERVISNTEQGKQFYIRDAGGRLAVTGCLGVETILTPAEVWPEYDIDAQDRIVSTHDLYLHPSLLDTTRNKLSISRLAAAREHRGSGAAFLGLAESWGAERGCIAAVLNCGYDNDKLTRYYLSQGYDQCGIIEYNSPRTRTEDGMPLRVKTMRFAKVFDTLVK